MNEISQASIPSSLQVLISHMKASRHSRGIEWMRCTGMVVVLTRCIGSFFSLFALSKKNCKEKKMNSAVTNILSSPPSSVTDAQLVDLYACIIREEWPLDANPMKPAPKDHILYLVWFCRHMPSILTIVSDVQKHLRDEYTWVDHAQLMESAVSQNKENLPIYND